MFEPSQLNQSPVSLAMQRACSEALGVAGARMEAASAAEAPFRDCAREELFEAVAHTDRPRAQNI